MTRLLPLAFALAAFAGAAHAGAPEALRDAVFAGRGAPGASPAAAVTYAKAPPPLPEGVARTSVDHAFDRRTSASVGFLCGLDERVENRGAMGAYGEDPQGRFVGAKLHLTFR